MILITFVTGERFDGQTGGIESAQAQSLPAISHTHVLHTCPFNLTFTSSLHTDSQTTLQLNCIIHCILPFNPVSFSFTASLTNLSFHDAHLLDHLSVSHHQHHLTSHHQHSTTLTNTRPLPATLSSETSSL